MKRKLLSVFLALCMTLTLVPAASAYRITDSAESPPEGAKFKVDYYKDADPSTPVETRYFNNVGNDDGSSEDGTTKDHFWDPITVMGDDQALSGCTRAVITLFQDIELTDTTILVAKGHDVTITSDGEEQHKITCTLTGTLGNNLGSAHVPGQDAISIANDSEENKLTLSNVSVEIKGPQAQGTTGQTDIKDTQGICNDGELHLYEGAKVMVDGVSQNGINGSGTLTVTGEGAQVDVKNVGGSGIKGEFLAVGMGAAVTVNSTKAHGITVGGLQVEQARVTTTETALYGITAGYINMYQGGALSATCAEGAKVPASIRVLEGGAFYVASDATVTGTAWADNVTGDGCGNVTALSSAASIENTEYATLQNAVEGASENDTIQLLRDVTLTEKLTIDKAITLDGNGKTITGQKNSSDVFLKVIGNDVTLQNLKAKDFGGSAVVTQGDTNLTITGCTFGQPGAEVKNGISVNTGTGNSTVTMQNTTITATNAIVELSPDTDTGTSTVNIKSGYYTGGFKVGNGCKIEVSGGYFTADPTSYLTTKKAALVSDNPNYIFVVKEASANAADVIAGETTVDDRFSSGATEDDKELASEISTAIETAATAPTFEGGVSAAVNEVANSNKLTANDGKVELKKAGVITNESSTDVHIVIHLIWTLPLLLQTRPTAHSL